MAALEISQVGKTFGPVTALDGVSLDIADGELLVLVGPSGCGKTTLLRLIAGLDTVSAGQIYVGGAPMADVPAKARDLAMVFQSYALYPHMTVSENMGFGLRMRGIVPTDRAPRIERAAEMLGMSGLLNRVPAELSGGQRQRVAMGRAIARRPAAFLMDEPLSNLDAELRLSVRREIKELQRQLGVTTIYVTHDQVEAMTLADRIAIFEGGRLQQVGAPSDLYHRPANAFVAGFLGTPPMSLVPGRVAIGQVIAEGFEPYTPRPSLRDGPVTIGLRPEAMTLGGGAANWRGRVESVEWLGTETLVHLAAGETRLTLRVSGLPQLGNDTAAVATIDLDAAHLFDLDGQILRTGKGASK